MKKYLPDSLLLTKEAIEQHMLQLRKEKAAQFGLTLEEWDKAVIEGKTLQQLPSGSLNS